MAESTYNFQQTAAQLQQAINYILQLVVEGTASELLSNTAGYLVPADIAGKANAADVYTKQETYSQAQVDALIQAIRQFTIVVASELPAASASTMYKIYLIPSSNPETQNTKDEYITVEESGSYRWEMIGSTAIDISGKADIADLEDGTIIPALAANLEPWADQDDLTVENTWDDEIRTTAGSSPIVSDKGGLLMRIVPKTDFACTKLVTSGENQLRLVADGGIATAVGTGFFFPVPKLTFGEYGSARENNGIVFVNSDGENMNPTVYFKPLASGVPTSITDGTQLTAQSNKNTANQNGGIYTDHNYKFYLTPGPGYLIVSGITRTTTCARYGWEDWYDRYIAVDDENDGGGSLDLSSIFSTLHSDVNKALIISTVRGTVYDFAEWTSDTNCRWTRKVGRVASPSWANTQNEDETYTHSLTISGMKSGGVASIEGQTQELSVEGTTVSYTDENATALSGAVKYELATIATGNLTINRAYILNDCGVEMLQGASGEAFITSAYARNIADALAEIATHNLDEITKVVAEAIVAILADIASLKHSANRLGDAEADSLNVHSVPTIDGFPMILYAAGVPSASLVPVNWDKETMGEWTGIPCFIGQVYINTASGTVAKRHYDAINTTSVSGWV